MENEGPNTRIASLDALRGALALCVFIAHAWQTFLFPVESRDSIHAALLGASARISVVAFFVVSGIAIAESICRNTARGGHFALKEFVLQRFFRIFPPLLVVIAMTKAIELALAWASWSRVNNPTAVRQLFQTSVTDQFIALVSLCTRGHLPGNWLNGPLWSLAFEIQAYVLAGLAVAALRGQRVRDRCFAAAVLAAYITLLCTQVGFLSQLPLQLMCLGAFSCGVAARLKIKASRRTALRWAVGSGTAAVLVTVFADAPRMHLDRPIMLLAQALSASSIAGLLVALGNVEFGGSSLLALGRFSYTLYIAHFPIMLSLYFVMWHSAPAWLYLPWVLVTTLAATAATLFACRLLGGIVERPHEQRLATEGFVRRWMPSAGAKS